MTASVWRLFAGRFQPFHNGHLWIVRHLAERYGKLVIGIVNPDPEHPPDINYPSFHPLSNPFSYWERLHMIRETLADEKLVDRVIVVPLRHPRAELDSDLAFLPPTRKWVIPPLDEHEREKILDLQRLGETVEEIEVPEALRFLSSSLIRDCLHQKKGTCLAVTPGAPRRCCPEAVAATLLARSAVFRIEKLFREFNKGRLQEKECPMHALTEPPVGTATAIRDELLATLSECRQIVDALYAEPKPRLEAKRLYIGPLEEQCEAAARTGDASALIKVRTEASALRQRLAGLLAKKGG